MPSNREYSAAAKGGRNVGADASRSETRDAIRTSLGVKGKLGITRKASPAFNGTKGPSSAGLDSAKSAWVNPKGSGYPTTRVRGPKLPQDLRHNFGSFGSSSASSGMVNYVRGSSGNSSVSRLATRQKFDRMF